ncbi:hypothetical protein PAXINDRAFT_40807, partial [Paxillus involutus ATCC 200175]
LLAQYNMQDTHPVSTPIETGLRLTRKRSPTTDDERIFMECTSYKSSVSFLSYVAQGT